MIQTTTCDHFGRPQVASSFAAKGAAGILMILGSVWPPPTRSVSPPFDSWADGMRRLSLNLCNSDFVSSLSSHCLRQTAYSIVTFFVLSCGEPSAPRDAGLPPGLECWDSRDCPETSTCRLLTSETGRYFTVDGGTGEQRCNSVVAGRCFAGQLSLGCYCYIGPNTSLPDLPDDGRGHLVCAD